MLKGSVILVQMFDFAKASEGSQQQRRPDSQNCCEGICEHQRHAPMAELQEVIFSSNTIFFE